MRRVVLAFILLVLAAAPAPALDAPRYLDTAAIDLTLLLPSPPARGSPAEAVDVAAVTAAQREASPERLEQAAADDRTSLLQFVGALLGPHFTAEVAPQTFALLRQVSREGNAVSENAKARWGRPRPFAVSEAIHAMVGKPHNAAYPSGHTLYAYEMAVLLGAMVPDKRDALFARAAEYGESRIIIGMHFPTDVEAGRIAGTALAALLLQAPAFAADFAAAKAELRAIVGP